MTAHDLISPDAKLRRKKLAQALSDEGFPTAEATLATMACRGGGPPYQLYGRIPLYRWGDALSWAQGRLSQPIRATAELDVQHAALRRRPETNESPRGARDRPRRDELGATAELDVQHAALT